VADGATLAQAEVERQKGVCSDPMRLTDAQFWEAHEANRQTPEYRALRRKKLRKVWLRCFVCGWVYMLRGVSCRALQMDHKSYWRNGELIFGKETLADFRACCPRHHLKGVNSDETVLAQRRGIGRALAWFLVRLPWRLLILLLRGL